MIFNFACLFPHLRKILLSAKPVIKNQSVNNKHQSKTTMKTYFICVEKYFPTGNAFFPPYYNYILSMDIMI